MADAQDESKFVILGSVCSSSKFVRGRLPFLWRSCARIASCIGGAAFGLATILYWSAHKDDRVLRQHAEAVTVGLDTVEEKLVALNSWVYHNQGFQKNPNYFWWKHLGPTPNQVLANGGDCSD